jgi:hypothetical protein
MKHFILLSLFLVGCTTPELTRPDFTLLTPGQKSQVGITAPVVYSFTVPDGAGIMFTDNDSIYFIEESAGTKYPGAKRSHILPKHANLWPGEIRWITGGKAYVIYTADGRVEQER